MNCISQLNLTEMIGIGMPCCRGVNINDPVHINQVSLTQSIHKGLMPAVVVPHALMHRIFYCVSQKFLSVLELERRW